MNYDPSSRDLLEVYRYPGGYAIIMNNSIMEITVWYTTLKVYRHTIFYSLKKCVDLREIEQLHINIVSIIILS